MPIYEYECENCEQTVEIWHKWGQKGVKCPECKSQRLKRLISSPALFDLRGPGFHKNDYPKLTIYKDKGRDD